MSVFFSRAGGLDRQLTAAPAVHKQRITRIGREVDNRRLKLVLIRFDHWQVAAMHNIKVNPLINQLPQQNRELGQEVTRLKYLTAECLLTRISQQHLDEVFRPHRKLMNLLEIIKARITDRVHTDQMVIIQHDACQHIIKIMRNTTGELANRLHLLTLGKTQL